MKYNWSIRAVSRQMKIWLCLLVFLVSIFSVSIINVQHAFADQNAQWIDKVTLVIGTTRYVDGDPFDSDNTWHGALHGKDAGGDECYDKVTIDNYDDNGGPSNPGGGGGTRGQLQKYLIDTSGNCTKSGEAEKVNLTGAENRYVTAYQLDADTVFMPVFITYPSQNVYTSLGKSGPVRDGRFTRLKNSDEACQQYDRIVSNQSIDNGKCAVFIGGGGGLPLKPGGGNISWWVSTKDKHEQKYAACAIARGVNCGESGVDIWFANNRNITSPPEVAGYKTSATAADDAAANNTTVAPTCASNNSALVIGWLVCSLIDALDSAVSTATEAINNLLSFSGEDFRTDPGLHTVWSLFRAIASFSLLGVALVMIIGQAIGGGE